MLWHVMHMTVSDFFNGVVYAGGLTTSVVGIFAFAQFVIVKPIRNFLRKEIVANLTSIKAAIEVNTRVTQDLDDRLTQHISNGGHTYPEGVQRH